MKRIAILFPGQGAQAVGMGQELSRSFPIARQTFEEADDLLSYSLSKIMFEGPETLLVETRYSQLALFAAGAAAFRVVQQELSLEPAAAAGLSLGEYTALFASGRLGFAETLSLVRLRAELMNEACETSKGTMAAVLGLAAEQIEEIVSGIPSVWVANYNCPGQTVISGTLEGVEKAMVCLKEKGAKRVLPLSVHGAFHSGLMQSAANLLGPAIQRAPIVESLAAFAMNVPGDFVEGVDAVKQNLTLQVTHPVRWEQSVRALMGQSIDVYLELGCGKTLTGLVKKTHPAAVAYSMDKPADLDQVVQHLEGGLRCSS